MAPLHPPALGPQRPFWGTLPPHRARRHGNAGWAALTQDGPRGFTPPGAILSRALPGSKGEGRGHLAPLAPTTLKAEEEAAAIFPLSSLPEGEAAILEEGGGAAILEAGAGRHFGSGHLSAEAIPTRRP